MANHPQILSRMWPCQRCWNSAAISLVFCFSLHACSCVFEISAQSVDGLRLDLHSSGALSPQRSMHGPDSVKESSFTSCKHLVIRAGIVVSRVIVQMVVFGTLTLLYCYHKKSFSARVPIKEGAYKTLSNPKLPNFTLANTNVNHGSTKSEFPKSSTFSTAKLVSKKAWKSRGVRKEVEQSADSADNTGPSGPLNLSTDTVIVRISDLKQASPNSKNNIEEGEFGPVYVGRFPSTQIEVFVKVQAKESHQGARAFATEDNDIFSRAKNPNLVLLVGCSGEKSVYVLVYHFICGGTLQDRLYGLKFLRSDGNIHRHIKTANTLTTSGDATVIDSGLSKFLDLELLGKLRTVLLELVSGRGSLNTGLSQAVWKITHWTRTCLRPGDLDTVNKALLYGEFTRNPVTRRVVGMAMACAELRSVRRQTVSEVVFELESFLKDAQAKDTPQLAEKDATLGLRAELLELLSKSRSRSLIGDGAGTPVQTRSKAGSNVRRLLSKTKSVVVPATRTDHPLWLPLTNLDRVVNPTFISVIFVYENVLTDKGYGKTFEDVTTSLKDSLAMALVDFYPLAGRLTLKESGHVDLQCNDSGAIFIEASVNLELSQLEGPGPMPMLSGMDDVMNNVAQMSPGLQYIPDQINPEIPVLVIQVTRFTCGSVAVAVNWHHTVADGFSGCHFVRSWAGIATGQALGLRPSFDRQLLQPRSPTDGSRIIDGNYGSSPTCNQTSDIPRSQVNTVAVTTPMIKPFALKKDTVQRLKDGLNNHIEAGSNTNGVSRPFTSVETISAELWKLIAKSRSLIHDQEARSRFFMFVDGRKRLGLPPGYFGNVVCSACAETTQDELLKRPLSYAASLIQTATKGIDSEYFRSLIDWVEERGIESSKGCESEHVHSTGNDVAATFWISFPLYEINFGWGVPIMSFRNAPPRKFIDGIAMMPDPKGSGNMVALLNLHADRMERLEQDLDFRNIVQLLDSKSTRS